MPNAKELQSTVDYTRSPDTTRSAAIESVFNVTSIRDALGKVDYPFYWSSTTHKRMGGGETAVYFAFGRSQGWMSNFDGEYDLLDVHGAGSQRSDPKAGDPSRFPRGRGPQGDVIAIYNMVRPVRGGESSYRGSGPKLQPQPSGRPSGGTNSGARPGSGDAESARRGFGNRQGSRRPMGGNPSKFIRRLDRNGDGKVSRQEFDGPPNRFDHHDRNGDGYLSEDEAPQRPPRGNRSSRFQGRPEGPAISPIRRIGHPGEESAFIHIHRWIHPLALLFALWRLCVILFPELGAIQLQMPGTLDHAPRIFVVERSPRG